MCGGYLKNNKIFDKIKWFHCSQLQYNLILSNKNPPTHVKIFKWNNKPQKCSSIKLITLLHIYIRMSHLPH